MPTKLKEDVQSAFRPGTQTSGSRREITIIKEGWGASGYYPGRVLERDIPKVFPAGTPMYLNHPTLREDHERPERDVRDLVGKLVETPRMAGAESVSVAHIYPHWEPVINALAEDIGLSINAGGELKEGSAGGKTGPIVESIDEGRSIDFVTEAGAGGKIGPLIESARRNAHEDEKTDLERLEESIKSGTWTSDELQAIESTTKELLEKVKPIKEDVMSDEDKRRLADLEESVKGLKTELDSAKKELVEEKKRGDRAEEALVLREAGKIADEIAGEVTDLPKRAKARVIETALAGDLPVNSEGKLLESEFKEKAKKALKEEVEYISETSGKGKVRGAGSTSQFHESAGSSGGSEDEGDDATTTALQESFERRGMSKDAAKAAAEGR